MFRTPWAVRFADVDNAGIIYYPRFFHAFHVAFEEFWEREAKRPYHLVLHRDRVGFPAVHIESDFRKTVTFGDPLEIRVGVKRFGNRSVVFRYEVVRTDTGEVHAAADITKAVVDMNTFRPIVMPAVLRTILERIKIPE
jgi:4-hydroxybenzoyl-CoA thioesterase